jgi:hypothetical protein
MPVKEDFWLDIELHSNRGCPLAKNLCDEEFCEEPHCEPVELNGVSEPQVNGAGRAGRRLCIICDRACDLKHEDFINFVKSMCTALDKWSGCADSWDVKVKVWRALVQFGLDGKFK